MQIDWFTFGAQIINFLVLVWLLKRFLYQPILSTIDRREQSIAERLDDASRREAAAQAAKQALDQREAELDHLKESLLADARRETETWRFERLRELRTEIDETRSAWNESLNREQRQFLGELRERTVRQVQELTRHVLRELADCRLERQVIQRFLVRLDEESDSLRQLSCNGRRHRSAVLRTAFSLSAEDEAALTDEVRELLGVDDVRIEVDPDLICGIELVAGDHKLQWNVDGYLDALHHSIESALKHAAPAAAPA